jgi:uncharacterized membrane protein
LFRAKGQEIQMAHNHGHERDREHAHDHDHGHQHGHDHEPGHGHAHGRFGRLQELIPFLHGHSHGEQPVDAALEGSDRGLWALKVSLLGLGLTAAFQLVIVLISGSVGLLADTIHNASDALTALPLGIAFVLGRRPATRRYTYGYGRAEDVAGVLIVALIFLSAVVAAYESVHKLLHPQALHNLGWVMVAAIVGFLGNEAVAVLRIRVGRAIGSAASPWTRAGTASSCSRASSSCPLPPLRRCRYWMGERGDSCTPWPSARTPVRWPWMSAPGRSLPPP